MTDRATIRHAKGGYIVEVRWPYAGRPGSSGEAVSKTFREAVVLIAKHLATEVDPAHAQSAEGLMRELQQADTVEGT